VLTSSSNSSAAGIRQLRRREEHRVHLGDRLRFTELNRFEEERYPTRRDRHEAGERAMGVADRQRPADQHRAERNSSNALQRELGDVVDGGLALQAGVPERRRDRQGGHRAPPWPLSGARFGLRRTRTAAASGGCVARYRAPSSPISHHPDAIRCECVRMKPSAASSRSAGSGDAVRDLREDKRRRTSLVLAQNRGNRSLHLSPGAHPETGPHGDEARFGGRSSKSIRTLGRAAACTGLRGRRARRP